MPLVLLSGFLDQAIPMHGRQALILDSQQLGGQGPALPEAIQRGGPGESLAVRLPHPTLDDRMAHALSPPNRLVGLAHRVPGVHAEMINVPLARGP